MSEIIKKHFKPLLGLVNASQNDLESRNDTADLESRNDTAVANASDSCLELPFYRFGRLSSGSVTLAMHVHTAAANRTTSVA